MRTVADEEGFIVLVAGVWLYAVKWKISGRRTSCGNSRILDSSNPSQDIWIALKSVSMLEYLSLNEHWTNRIVQLPNLLKLNGENGMMMKGAKDWKFCPHSFQVHQKLQLFSPPKDIPLELRLCYRLRVVATGTQGEGRLNEPHINAKLESNGARRIGGWHCWEKRAEPSPPPPPVSTDWAYRTELRLWVYKTIIP
jgi:hypothetical protein